MKTIARLKTTMTLLIIISINLHLYAQGCAYHVNAMDIYHEETADNYTSEILGVNDPDLVLKINSSINEYLNNGHKTNLLILITSEEDIKIWSTAIDEWQIERLRLKLSRLDWSFLKERKSVIIRWNSEIYDLAY